MTQPEGFVDSKLPNAVCKLNRSLYGLKQAPRAWFDTLKMFLLSLGFTRSVSDSSLFFRKDKGSLLLILVYVDDILLTGDDSKAVNHVISLLGKQFALKTMGEVNYFLGLEASRTPHGSIFLKQSKYLKDLLTKTKFEGCKPTSTPMAVNLKLALGDSAALADPSSYRSTMGALQYLTLTRPDISFAVNKLSQFLHNPTINHWQAVKHLLRYLKGTSHLGLEFKPSQRLLLAGYSDSDYVGNIDDRKSTSGSCQFLGDCLVSWFSKKQNCVSLSTAEAEYISAAFCCTQLLWMKQTLADYKCSFENVPIFCDNISAINIAQNAVHHNRTKHIEIRHHFLRDCVSKRKIEISFVPSQDQLADIFTKPLSSETFSSIRARLGIMHIE
ncbi:hypothetical protein DH2020_029055 [Rehmannia glutinosa]|uniref:Reverse transcriptase Ty1/copia-type domain-containing protein n=1 Tax=Rehmannia glutinosa TaxID=99300 RepID=A0ABR0VSN2_REHGL